MELTARRIAVQLLLMIGGFATAKAFAWCFALDWVERAIIALFAILLFREPLRPVVIDYRTKGVRLDQ